MRENHAHSRAAEALTLLAEYLEAEAAEPTDLPLHIETSRLEDARSRLFALSTPEIRALAVAPPAPQPAREALREALESFVSICPELIAVLRADGRYKRADELNLAINQARAALNAPSLSRPAVADSPARAQAEAQEEAQEETQMTVAELIAKLQTLPQDAPVFAVSEYDAYTEIKHADFVETDHFDNSPHVALSEYGASEEEVPYV